MACAVEMRGGYRLLGRKCEGKGQSVKLRHSWEDDIKIYLQEVGCGGVDWVDLAQDGKTRRALVNA